MPLTNKYIINVRSTWQPRQMAVMKGANQSHYFYHCCAPSFLAMDMGEV